MRLVLVLVVLSYLGSGSTALLAREAVFADGVLRLDTVQVGTNTYAAVLVKVPNVSPLTFTLQSATKVTSSVDAAATFSGTSLAISDVLVNGSMRASARLTLVGTNPYRFQLSTYSVLRSVEVDSLGQALTPGRAFSVKYTGAVLASEKVNLKIGTTQLQPSVVENVITTFVPTGLSGSQSLVVELDGQPFQIPVAISAGAAIANPKPYVSGYINQVATSLRNLSLPTGVLDIAQLSSQIAALSDADAQLVALQIRANLEPLLAELNQSMNLTASVAGMRMQALTHTSDEECTSHMLRFTKFAVTAYASAWLTASSITAGPLGLVTGSVAAATLVIAADQAVEEMLWIVDHCGALNNATFNQSQLMDTTLTLSTPIELFESRPRTFKLTEFVQLGQSIRSTYSSTASTLKSTLARAITVVGKLGFSSSSSVVTSLGSIAAAITTDDTRTISTDAHKFVPRAPADTTLVVSSVNSIPGSLTLMVDVSGTDIPQGQSRNFMLDLHNAEDGITIRVPVKLNGASLLEDLKEAALGIWTVTAYEGAVVLDLELRRGGKGAYLIPLTPQDTQSTEGGYCKKWGYPPGMSGTQVGKNCEYPLTWSISQRGNVYEFSEGGLWLHDGCCVITRQALSLPLTSTITYGNGTPLRTYVKK